MNQKVAVHYNFAKRRLSVREIRGSGALGRLLDVVDDVIMKDCELTSDHAKWRKWNEGAALHVRQFAEVRGALLALSPRRTSWTEVTFDPASGPDFTIPGGAVLTHARLVRISGKKIFAAGDFILAE